MLKQQILELRSQNKTYQEISQILHCSKSTVCYYCGDNQKEKNNNRLKKIRQKRHPYAKKIEFFCQSYNKPINKTQISTFRKRIECKIRSFHRIQHSKLGIKAMYQSPSFTVDDVINKFGENPKCYLTGDTINLCQQSQLLRGLLLEQLFLQNDL